MISLLSGVTRGLRSSPHALHFPPPTWDPLFLLGLRHFSYLALWTGSGAHLRLLGRLTAGQDSQIAPSPSFSLPPTLLLHTLHMSWEVPGENGGVPGENGGLLGRMGLRSAGEGWESGSVGQGHLLARERSY